MSAKHTHISDVLVIGAGLAAERSAIEAAEAGLSVIILSLVPPRRSHSTAAQGGMQASLGNAAMAKGDNPQIHFEDTVKGSDWGCDQEVAKMFTETVPSMIRQLDYWGVPWNRVTAGKKKLPSGLEVEDTKDREGLITARDFGGVAKWRCCYTSDGTGHTVQFVVDTVVCKLGIPVHDRMEAISLIHDGETCFGAVARDLRTGDLNVYLAKSTVIATGGAGRIYAASTNAVINEGTGGAIALSTGVVPLGNMEAVQFHPTGMPPVYILMTEGARGDGGYLLDKNLHRFMPDYEPKKKELASRDVVSRRMVQHIRAGYGVDSKFSTQQHLWLDIRHLGRQWVWTNLREIATIATNFNGLDPAKDLVPVIPTQHYTMGGVRTNKDGFAYGLKGLFAIGEAACWDLHGFNRLGGNSLAETVTAGYIVGKQLAKYTLGATQTFNYKLIEDFVKKEEERIKNLISGKNGRENVWEIRAAMQTAMMDHVHIFRTGPALEQGVAKLQELYRRSLKIGLRSSGQGANPELAQALRMPGMLRTALCVAYGALMRTESRGSHFREDYPKRDDTNWLKRTLAYWKEGADLPTLDYEPVACPYMPPGDRGYGEATAGPKK
ncbi:fumarate reductase flavoprotein subunit [Pelotomaculum propionicicum]|uniref:succinate dehydrogenase n=1 Tax=Pelotomaculum propionicicum TaxID=258475 RepID=A0A4Y7RLL6_9FIRM|nr:fumarate reductase flavoprotein subunit [Pelotomaculum propionicicum]TEB09197.1 Fumarate reductase flavoprotein subunit [Pelotomaculum propionicicum]